MTPAQCRAAKGLINMSQRDLAKDSELSISTVVDFERERRVVAPASIGAMRVTLEEAGAVFFEENDYSSGVALRKVEA